MARTTRRGTRGSDVKLKAARCLNERLCAFGKDLGTLPKQVIDWLNLIPNNEDFSHAITDLQGVVHLRLLCKELVRSILEAYPWAARRDLVSVFDPSKSYQPGDRVAFPVADPQSLRPSWWRTGVIKATSWGENAAQGKFQIVKVEIDGNFQHYAAGIPNTKPLPLDDLPHESEDLDTLASTITDAYLPSLKSTIIQATNRNLLQARLAGDQILLGNAQGICGEEESYYLSDLFSQLPAEQLWLTTQEILLELRRLGCLNEISDELAFFTIEEFLQQEGYQPLGAGRWTTSDRFEAINRIVDRRLHVPILRSKVALRLAQAEGLMAGNYNELELDPQAENAIKDLEQTEPNPVVEPGTWQPPSTPIQMPLLTYLHILEAYFPLDKRLSRAFDPRVDPCVVDIQVIEGEPLRFLVSRQEGLVKCLAPDQFHYQFRSEQYIPAGTYLWLEYLRTNSYRIAPKPLAQPRTVTCKLADLVNGRLQIEETEIPIRYESDPYIFKADLRFEDIEALFKEAEQSGNSIFDALWYTFESLAQKNPDVKLHHREAFNAVFFQHRMCSPRSVVAELYSRPCFVPVGEGYFRFDPTKGIKPKASLRQRTALDRDRSTAPHPPQPASGYFIFQQRTDPDYADQIGLVYNWKRGIPGANQIRVGARFIYYLPGEKVFFGSGVIARIERYEANTGNTYYNGHIEDYQAWKPALPLTSELAKQVSFISPDHLWIGQAGIRQISAEDFAALENQYRQTSELISPDLSLTLPDMRVSSVK